MKTIQINNKHYQECDVVMLPTDKADGCLLKGFKTLQYYPKEFFTQEYLKSTNRKSEHLYILSNEEIKEGDYRYSKIQNNVALANNIDIETNYYKERKDVYFKVIATTNSSLTFDVNGNFITDGISVFQQRYDIVHIPQIPQQFIEYFISEYNKGNVISKVLVEVEHSSKNSTVNLLCNDGNFQIKLNQNNEISILTEEVNPTTQIVREAMRIVSKDVRLPKVIKDKLVTEQEALEEASWRFNPLKKLDGEFLRAAFIKGAKWQAERMYSREEVIELLNQYRQFTWKEGSTLTDLQHWIQQNLK